MTPITRKESNEGNAIMTHAAIPAAKDFTHRHGIGPGYWHERSRMTVRAVQPDRMGLVGKADIRHFPGVSHRDVEVEHVHLVGGRKARPGRNDSGTQGSHPVWKAHDISLHVPGCVINSLQPRQIGIGLIINPVSLKGNARRVHLDNETFPCRDGGILYRRHIGCRLQIGRTDGFSGERSTRCRTRNQQQRD